jgi:hypothetical protein
VTIAARGDYSLVMLIERLFTYSALRVEKEGTHCRRFFSAFLQVWLLDP